MGQALSTQLMQIGQLATATGLSRDALRFYERRGLLPSTRQGNGYREYPAEAIEWLRYLRSAQALGFTLAEIETDWPLISTPDLAAPALRAALRRKLLAIDERIAGLTSLRAELALRLTADMAICPLARNNVVAVSPEQ